GDDHFPGSEVIDRLLDRGERVLLDGCELRAHGCMVTRRSTYLANTSTSRLTSSPAVSSLRVVSASVCGIRATAKPSSSSAATVRETPSTAIEPFSTV